jgi:proteic killer suppression protein
MGNLTFSAMKSCRITVCAHCITMLAELPRVGFESGKSARFGSIVKVATRKLIQLEAAATLEFLRSPPGNRLEALAGDREGQDSIRVNYQWRICFRRTPAGPEDAEHARVQRFVVAHESAGRHDTSFGLRHSNPVPG